MFTDELVLGLLGLAAYLFAGGYAAVKGLRWWIALWRDEPSTRGDRQERDETRARAALYGRLGGGAK